VCFVRSCGGHSDAFDSFLRSLAGCAFDQGLDVVFDAGGFRMAAFLFEYTAG